MPFDFTGKKILVTRAGRGFGRALVNALVEAGGEVYALSLTKESLDSLVEEFPGVHPLQVDLTDWEATRKEVDKIEPLDGLVNNAGINIYITPSLEVDKETTEKVMSVNMMAAINVTQSVARKMVKAGIVNNSSMCGFAAVAEVMAYCISKAGLDMVTKQFALELGPHNIRVNSINPSFCLTDLTRKLMEDPKNLPNVRAHTPLKRFGELSEFADVMMFLLNDHSAMITGTLNKIDGGLLCHIPL